MTADAMTEGVATKVDVARLENKMDGMATKAELYRAMWLQTFAIPGGVGLLIKLLP